MRFTVASVLAFAAAVLAAESKDKKFDPINVPTFNEVIPAGKPFTVEWENPAPYTEGPVTIQLFAGKDGNSLVAKGDVIASMFFLSSLAQPSFQLSAADANIH